MVAQHWMLALWFSMGSGPVFIRNPIAVWFYSGSGPPMPLLWIRAWYWGCVSPGPSLQANTMQEMKMKITWLLHCHVYIKLFWFSRGGGLEPLLPSGTAHDIEVVCRQSSLHPNTMQVDKNVYYWVAALAHGHVYIKPGTDFTHIWQMPFSF